MFYLIIFQETTYLIIAKFKVVWINKKIILKLSLITYNFVLKLIFHYYQHVRN